MHGQYDLKSTAHGLTDLGREQAAITAQRVAALAADGAAIDDHYGRRPVRLVRLVHSGVARAAETAAIIAKALPPHVALEVDTLLAEGYPCIPEPCRVQVTTSSSPPPLLLSHARLRHSLAAVGVVGVRRVCSCGSGVSEIL